MLTEKEVAALIGLRYLADKANRLLDEYGRLAREITGEDDDLGHTWDYITGGCSLEELFDLLKLTRSKENQNSSAKTHGG